MDMKQFELDEFVCNLTLCSFIRRLREAMPSTDIPTEISGTCVRIPLNYDYELSLAIPTDANNFRLHGPNQFKGLPTTAETALFKRGKMIYEDDMGYDIFCPQWGAEASPENIKAIIDEIERLKKLIEQKTTTEVKAAQEPALEGKS